MRWILLALLAAAAGPAAAQTADCSQAQTQTDATECAGGGAKAADAELNKEWAKAMAAARGGPAAGPLREAQRAWIAYRDLACQAEAARYEGGSIAPMVQASCIERLTRARTADLKLFQEN